MISVNFFYIFLRRPSLSAAIDGLLLKNKLISNESSVIISKDKIDSKEENENKENKENKKEIKDGEEEIRRHRY